MKKDKNELVRLKSIIENDRFSAGDDFGNLVLNDLNKFMSDYFDLKSAPGMEIAKEGDRFKVCIRFDAYRIKSFSSVPK